MMKVIIEDTNDKKIHLNRIIEWLVGMVGYAIILIAVSLLFPKTLHIDSNLFGMWALVAAIITFILNKIHHNILFYFFKKRKYLCFIFLNSLRNDQK